MMKGMKTRNRIAVAGALACVVLAACTRDPLQGPVAPGTEMVFTATLSEGPGTKTVLRDDGVTVYWTTDEDIKVFFGNSMSGQFHSTNADASLTATFSGSLSGDPGSGTEFWALYPYDPEAACDGSSVTMTLPSAQQGVAGTFADKMFPLLARSSDRNLAFYNVCGGARFSVTKPGITAVTFRSIGDEPLAGKVQVGFDPDGKPEVQEVLDGVSTVTVTAPEGGFVVGQDYFAILLPVVLEEGLTLEFQMADGNVITTVARRIEVRRAVFGMLDNIGPIDVTGVTLDREELSLPPGGTQALVASVVPDGATNQEVIWSSSDPDVVAVDENGAVTALVVGQATITVTTVEGGFTASCTVTVTPIAVTSITLDKTSLSFSSLNTTQKLTATVKPDNATYPTVTWSSSNTSVATVSSTGTVTSKGSGTTTITASADGKTATCTVTVSPEVLPTSISLDVSTLLVAVNESITLHATVLPENATDKTVTWTVSDAFASVSGEGVVEGVLANGEVTVTARTSNGKTATCTVRTVKTKAYPIYYEATGKCEFITAQNSSNTHIEAVFGNVYDSETRTGVIYCNEQPYYIDVYPLTSNDLKSRLTGITISSAVVISADAFTDCRNLASVTLPGNLKSIYSRAFANCTSLNSIVIPEGVTTIESGAFGNCTSLSSISLPSTLTALAGFAGCTALTSVTVPESVTSIAGAFQYCSNLSSFTRNAICPDGRALVLDNKLYFVAYSGITSYTVPSGVTTLGEYCLSTSLSSITIPASVTDMSGCSFFSWDSLTLTIKATTPPKISSSSEYFDPDLSTTDLQIIVPGSAEATYKNAANWNKWARYIKAGNF